MICICTLFHISRLGPNTYLYTEQHKAPTRPKINCVLYLLKHLYVFFRSHISIYIYIHMYIYIYINWSRYFSNWVDAPACTYNYYINIIISSLWTRQPVKRIADITNAVIDIFYADVKKSHYCCTYVLTWQNSGAYRMMLPARNRLSASLLQPTC